MAITPEKELLLYTLEFRTVLIQIQGYYTRLRGRRGIGRLSPRAGRRLPSAGLNPVGIAPQEADASSWGSGFPMSSFLSPLSAPCHGKIKKNHRRAPVYTSKRYGNTP
ncbi:hypothetical protein [Aeromonas media]|uniref:hypothetical protein n=1 Tax=Aeromonas media TaxID=651 RepID=UPI003D194C6D